MRRKMNNADARPQHIPNATLPIVSHTDSFAVIRRGGAVIRMVSVRVRHTVSWPVCHLVSVRHLVILTVSVLRSSVVLSLMAIESMRAWTTAMLSACDLSTGMYRTVEHPADAISKTGKSFFI